MDHTPDANNDVEIRQLLAALRSEGLPFLDRLGTDDGFEAYWRAIDQPWANEMLDYLGLARNSSNGGSSTSDSHRR